MHVIFDELNDITLERSLKDEIEEYDIIYRWQVTSTSITPEDKEKFE